MLLGADQFCEILLERSNVNSTMKLRSVTRKRDLTCDTAECARSLLMLRRSCSNAFLRGIFLISFSPLTNLSILMLSFTELMAADDYLN